MSDIFPDQAILISAIDTKEERGEYSRIKAKNLRKELLNIIRLANKQDPPVKMSKDDLSFSLLSEIRSKGWRVAIHNDYRLNMEFYTFWLFTKGEKAIKGEGTTDLEALQQVRDRILFSK